MLPWLKGVTFDKVQLEIRLLFNEKEGNILIWTTQQTGTERP